MTEAAGGRLELDQLLVGLQGLLPAVPDEQHAGALQVEGLGGREADARVAARDEHPLPVEARLAPVLGRLPRCGPRLEPGLAPVAPVQGRHGRRLGRRGGRLGHGPRPLLGHGPRPLLGPRLRRRLRRRLGHGRRLGRCVGLGLRSRRAVVAAVGQLAPRDGRWAARGATRAGPRGHGPARLVAVAIRAAEALGRKRRPRQEIPHCPMGSSSPEASGLRKI